MTRLLPLLLVCACAGSLVDHNDPALTSNVTCDDGKFKSGDACRAADSLSAGASHTCAVVAGTARCWGANDQGQLGWSGASSSFVPVQAAVIGAVSQIAAGSSHTCAIADGTVWCWGDNTFGQLGLGTVGDSSAMPRVVRNFSGVSLLAAGGSHTCAANAAEMRCWGRNSLGQLGNAASLPEAPRPDPTQVVGVAGPVFIAAGDAHTCAIGTSGVFCWGNNGAGQLGINQSGGAYSTPALINSSSLNGVAFLGLGANHSCAGTLSGTLFCWGANGVYQVDSSGQDQKSPRQSAVSARDVAGGTGHTCAIGNDESLQCWGLDDKGQLGVVSGDYGPFDVGLHGVTAVAAGNKHTCAVADGTTRCWGLNDRGQLGVDPTATPSTAMPTAVSSR